jgi:subfamily B ATP-binding cassette protein MsbA
MTSASAQPGAAKGEGGSQLAIARRILRTYLAPHWKALAAALLCAVLAGLLAAALSWMLNPIIKRMFLQKRPQDLLVIPLIIIILGVLRAVAQVGQAVITNRLGHRMVGEMQISLFGRLVRADLARLRAAHSGSFLSSVLYDASLIREGATTGVVNYIQAIVTVVANVGVMISQDWSMALIVLCAGPVISQVMRRFGKRTRRAAQGAMNETSALSTAVMESLDGVKLVQIDNREAYEEARVSEVVGRRQRHIIKGANTRAMAAPVTEMLSTVVVALIIAYAGWSAIHTHVGINNFFAFLTAMMIAAQSLRQVANLQPVIVEGLTAAGRLFQVLDIEPTIRDVAGAQPLELTQCNIRFEGVGFHYDAETPALTNVDLEVRRGETVALVGPSGGGKSTILNLIPRFYDATSGRVLIDEVDVRDVTLASLRDHIALVTQEPFLFDDTIRANIAYARPDATQAEVEAAASAAAAHEFIMALPSGYATLVGEAGARLSGGQRQRIAIARAFLKNAPILLLDEATSALDTESEAKVQEALERLMAGRTSILIAHRLSTVRRAHRIYVIEAGRVVEVGSHAVLMGQGGLYARLAKAQNLDPDAHVPADAPAPTPVPAPRKRRRRAVGVSAPTSAAG